MSDGVNPPVVYPRVWPDDPVAADELRKYMLWLESDGEEGSELGGSLDFRGGRSHRDADEVDIPMGI